MDSHREPAERNVESRVLQRETSYAHLQIVAAEAMAMAAGLILALDAPAFYVEGVLGLCLATLGALNGGSSRRVALISTPQTLKLRGSLWESNLAWMDVSELLVNSKGGAVLVHSRGRWKSFNLAMQGEALAHATALASALDDLSAATEFAGSIKVVRGIVPGLGARARMRTVDVLAMPIRLLAPTSASWAWLAATGVLALLSNIAARHLLG